MKLRYKAAIIMAIFGTVIVAMLSLGYDIYSRRIVIDKELENIKNLTREVSLYIESYLIEKTIVALTLSSAPVIKNALYRSNAEYAGLPAAHRENRITNLNSQWMKAADLMHPFVQSRMSNRVAGYLKKQQLLIPGVYGELFLTNHYGEMIAATGKLTTLSHKHKYWWQAAYNDGKGKIFLDDRGFDESVQGYVLGVVVPVKLHNKITGILKCNMNIMGSLTNIVNDFSMRYSCRMRIARTGGLVVAEKNVIPLATRVPEAIVEKLHLKNSGTMTTMEKNKEYLIAYAPIGITKGSEKIGFGGKKQSIDHIKGNKGEAWHVVVTKCKQHATDASRGVTVHIIIFGMIFTLLSTVAALFLGRLVARPIVALADAAQAIGDGYLDRRVEVTSRDEVGFLGSTLNEMSKNLQETMTSRDELIHEIDERKKIEEKLKHLSITDELTGIFNRRAFNKYLKESMSRAKRYSEPLSFLFLDLDHFKKVNDRHGHDTGDIILKTVVDIVIKTIRLEDKMARWGGEEFAVLLSQISIDNAFVLAERVREKISEFHFPVAGHVTVSIGLAEFQENDTFDSFVKRADMALYEAKSEGRNMVKAKS